MSVKAGVGELSLTQLSELVRANPRTMRRRLDDRGVKPCRQDGRTHFYRPWEALPAFFSIDRLDPAQEQARLARAKSELAEHELAERRGEYVAATAVELWLYRLLGAFVQRVRGMPSKAAPEVRVAASDAEAEAVLAKHVAEALTDLADACREAGERVERGEPRRWPRGAGAA